MPRRCTICEHEKRMAIDTALINNEPLRTIANRFGVSKSALIRHKKDHMPQALTRAQEAEQVAKADTLLEQVTELRDKALSILVKAEQAGDLRTALQGVREAKGCLELLARLQGELQERTTVNILINPQWLTLRAVILQALDGYPEARQALVRALKEVECNAGG